MTTPCRHPLCALIGGSCSLASGVSRGCRAGPGPARTVAPEVVAEVRDLLAALEPTPAADETARARQLAAAIRLAFLVRREARDDRSVLAIADELEPDVAARLEALCRSAT